MADSPDSKTSGKKQTSGGGMAVVAGPKHGKLGGSSRKGASSMSDSGVSESGSSSSGSSSSGSSSVGASGRDASPFFEIYKPAQGYYTRMGSALGGGVLVLGGGHFIWENLGVFEDPNVPWTMWLRMGVPALVVVGMGLLVYWLVGRNRNTSEFLIATEGEMKKVSWSTRNELIGSTKVVIAATLFLGFMLFVVDFMFIQFFQAINVLRSGGS